MSTKRSHILKQTCSWKCVQNCLSMCDLSLDTRDERVTLTVDFQWKALLHFRWFQSDFEFCPIKFFKTDVCLLQQNKLFLNSGYLAILLGIKHQLLQRNSIFLFFLKNDIQKQLHTAYFLWENQSQEAMYQLSQSMLVILQFSLIVVLVWYLRKTLISFESF